MNDIELKEEQPESVTILIDQPASIDPHEKAREEAFDATYDWKGQPLGPFTSGRRREWIRLRSLDGVDNSLLDDATKIVWLCLTPTDELIAKRRNPEAMSAEIWKWADASVGDDENEAILDLADKVLTASQSTRAVPIPSSGAESGN
jgi:hypothetical protein